MLFHVNVCNIDFYVEMSAKYFVYTTVNTFQVICVTINIKTWSGCHDKAAMTEDILHPTFQPMAIQWIYCFW